MSSISSSSPDKARPVASPPLVSTPGQSTILLGFGIFAFCTVVAFSKPLYDLLRFSLRSEMYSHVVLIPFVSLYFLWLGRRNFRPVRAGPTWPALFFLLTSAALAFGYLARARSIPKLAFCDYLALTVCAFLCLLWGGTILAFGLRTLRPVLFPMFFLVFIVPFPTAVTNGLEYFFQHTSADAANLMLKVADSFTDTPFLRQGLLFKLPGINIQVAQECSGIRSSFVLFITSLLAGHLFLASGWKKWLLAIAVVPLGILRNGFRIVVISMLCVHVNPNMIDSFIHHQGGPIFFLLSLVPFFLLLLWLRATDKKNIHPL